MNQKISPIGKTIKIKTIKHHLFPKYPRASNCSLSPKAWIWPATNPPSLKHSRIGGKKNLIWSAQLSLSSTHQMHLKVLEKHSLCTIGFSTMKRVTKSRILRNWEIYCIGCTPEKKSHLPKYLLLKHRGVLGFCVCWRKDKKWESIANENKILMLWKEYDFIDHHFNNFFLWRISEPILEM